MISIFRYPGGKAKLASQIISRFSDKKATVFMEPFCGGASVTIEMARLHPKLYFVINDVNSKMSDFWKTVISSGKDFAQEVRSYNPTVEDFIARKNKNDALSTLVLNRCSHSGRGGGAIGGMFQTGAWKIDARWNSEKLSEQILIVHELLKNRCGVFNQDGISLIKEANRFCKIYADPPYIKAGDSLYEKSFLPEDHNRLFETITRKDNWVLSYDNNSWVMDKYSGIADITVEEIKMYSAKHSGGSKKMTELIIYKR